MTTFAFASLLLYISTRLVALKVEEEGVEAQGEEVGEIQVEVEAVVVVVEVVDLTVAEAVEAEEIVVDEAVAVEAVEVEDWRNTHMGEIGPVISMCGSGVAGMSDRDIMAVISPPASERDRSALVAASSTKLPPQAAWRMSNPIGRKLDSGVKANFFALNPEKMSGAIYVYHVHIYKIDRTGTIDPVDVASKEDFRITTSLLLNLRNKHPEWPAKMGFAYDNRSTLFATKRLPLSLRNDKNERFLSETIGVSTNEDGESLKKRYSVSLTEVNELFPPTNPAEWMDLDATLLRAFDTSLFSFARWQQVLDTPSHFLIGSKIFLAASENFRLANCYIAKRGYYASLKSCMAGMCLVVDMSVNCFLASGDMPELMYKACGYRDFDEFYRDCSSSRGLRPDTIAKISKVVKNAKVKTKHTRFWGKVKDVGPRADDTNSAFDVEGKMMTVAQYFELKGKSSPVIYGKYLNKGKLRYPALPTINIGSNKKPVWIPAELVTVPGGQSRSQVLDGDMTAQMIRHAAVRPAERFEYITNGDGAEKSGIATILRKDETAIAFGVNNTEIGPMSVPAHILPQAKLRYAGDKVVDPGLAGTWNIDRPQMRFIKPPPGAGRDGGYMYGIVIVGDGPPPGPWQDKIKEFSTALEQDGLKAGVKLVKGGEPLPTNDRIENLTKCFEKMKNGGARIVLVVMLMDISYGAIKLVSNKMGLSTQCLKWKNVDRAPRGFQLNLLIKINIKLGGTNHTLVPRAPVKPGAGVFQDPPNSLSWLFDKHCMLVGIDVSHAEPNSERESMAAVVASMDGCASQYVAHLSAQNCREEMVFALRDAMVALLNQFKTRNGKVPAHIIIYRDGVSDGQFNLVLEKELPAVQDALELLGYPVGAVKVSIIICQKGHHTRLVYEEQLADGSTQFINPCPGLVVDSSGGKRSITNSTINEFYLNSHAAIQGTAKPCKYALIYDEIGFKLSELELLTYWTTYLYARCNKSVSYATPAYYAHWASKRAKTLNVAGGSGQDLLDISALWAASKNTMFFI
eukprot:gene26494-35157_t